MYRKKDHIQPNQISLLPTKFLQPVNLAISNLISLHPPPPTRSTLSLVTFSRSSTISSLKITDRSFRYASPHLRNQLADSFRQPRQSGLDSPPHPLVNPSLIITTLVIHRFFTLSLQP